MTSDTITRVSSADFKQHPEVYLDQAAAGRPLLIVDLGLTLAPTVDDDEQAELEEMVSYRSQVTGVANTVFISPRGKGRHGPRLKVAIDPPDSINPLSKTASVAFANGQVIDWQGPYNTELAKQIAEFVSINHAVLMDYWEYNISTDELQARLKPITT
jgi:hypothetical protein